ncbi:hypothetical protein HWV62_13307 [Athelia sp. TMB]|nr:hypothetical protein HWV62_13307 [Athelia sp. TMB]
MGTLHSLDVEDRMEFPLLVSQVNTTWRTLALNSSRLWASIVYKGFPKFVLTPVMLTKQKLKVNPHGLFYYPLIALFLQRSRAQPLDIHIDIRDPHHDYTVREVDVSGLGHPMDTLLHLLTPYAFRLRGFHFITNTWIDVIQLLLPFCVKPQGGAETAGLFGPVVQKKWPNVKHVVLSGTAVQWRLWCLPNLESLTLTFLAHDARPSSSEFRSMLQSVAHSLIYLDLQGSTPVDDTNELQTERERLDPIQLPALGSLCLGYAEPDHLHWIIQSINTPSIVSLEFRDLWECYKDFCQEIEQFSQDNMHDTIRDASSLFGMIMAHMPFNLRGLRHLTLRYVKLQPCLIDSLSVPALDGVAIPPERFLSSLPVLHTLTLEKTDFEQVAISIFHNPERVTKHALKVFNVDSCYPWRVGYVNPGREQVARETYEGMNFPASSIEMLPGELHTSQGDMIS